MVNALDDDGSVPGANTRLEAAKQILDRVGISKTERIDVNAKVQHGIFIYHQRMYEPKKIKGTLVPFGYKKSEDDPKTVIPIPEQLDVLQEAINYIRRDSLYKSVLIIFFLKQKKK